VKVLELSDSLNSQCRSEFLDFSVQWKPKPVDYQLLWDMKYKKGKSTKELAQYFRREIKTIHWMFHRINKGEVYVMTDNDIND
jgi:hypothetical protein